MHWCGRSSGVGKHLFLPPPCAASPSSSAKPPRWPFSARSARIAYPSLSPASPAFPAPRPSPDAGPAFDDPAPGWPARRDGRRTIRRKTKNARGHGGRASYIGIIPNALAFRAGIRGIRSRTRSSRACVFLAVGISSLQSSPRQVVPARCPCLSARSSLRMHEVLKVPWKSWSSLARTCPVWVSPHD